MRVPEIDKYITEKFGKPDWHKSFIENDALLTPIGKVKLWRIDPVPLSRQKERR